MDFAGPTHRAGNTAKFSEGRARRRKEGYEDGRSGRTIIAMHKNGISVITAKVDELIRHCSALPPSKPSESSVLSPKLA
jgi:hypothetical protein